MTYYIIVREKDSGGSVLISLSDQGLPYYDIYPERCQELRFCRRSDAEKYLVYCKRNMSTLAGQTDWKMLEVKRKGFWGRG